MYLRYSDLLHILRLYFILTVRRILEGNMNSKKW
jgi:hypothetical protein